MRARFTQAYKIQAVEKALKRANHVSLQEFADDFGIGRSTLGKWIGLAQKQKLEPSQNTEVTHMIKAKRPQDWMSEDRLNMIISCASLDDDQINELCREKGLFPHHIKQWKQDFVEGSAANTTASIRSDNKVLRHNNKVLQKEINRKDKALAETAALLVLQKKVNAIWGSDEDDLL